MNCDWFQKNYFYANFYYEIEKQQQSDFDRKLFRLFSVQHRQKAGEWTPKGCTLWICWLSRYQHFELKINASFTDLLRLRLVAHWLTHINHPNRLCHFEGVDRTTNCWFGAELDGWIIDRIAQIWLQKRQPDVICHQLASLRKTFLKFIWTFPLRISCLRNVLEFFMDQREEESDLVGNPSAWFHVWFMISFQTRLWRLN